MTLDISDVASVIDDAIAPLEARLDLLEAAVQQLQGEKAKQSVRVPSCGGWYEGCLRIKSRDCQGADGAYVFSWPNAAHH